MKIAVLLATYNSEKFLREQIDSLLAQSVSDFKIYIRDDGSDDSTLNIVDHYLKEYPQKIEFLHDAIKGRKAKGSFMWLLKNTDADYYMFCDHDDYWLPNKIELTLNQMKRCEATANPNSAVVVNTDLEVVDEQLNTISPSFWKYSKINRPLLSDFNYLSVYNGFTGCTMMLNQFAKQVALPISEKAIMHDVWVALKVSASGGVLGYVNQSTIKYRQHGSNVIGATEVRGKEYIYSKLNSLQLVVQSNRKRLEMVRSVRDFSAVEYWYYKLLYIIKR